MSETTTAVPTVAQSAPVSEPPAVAQPETNGTSNAMEVDSILNPTDVPATNGDDITSEIHAGAKLTSSSNHCADEVKLYDRQIRLWGLQAQENIKKANVLLISMKALANEIAKNLVLAGIASLTILDHEAVTEADLETQFFVTMEEIGKNRAEAAAPRVQKLNKRVTVKTDTTEISEKLTTHPTFLSEFTIVIATDLSFPTLSMINAATQMANKPLYAGGSHGYYGYIFVDLVKHTYTVERTKSNMETNLGPESATRQIVGSETKKNDGGKLIETVTKEETYNHILLANTSPLPADILSNRRKKARVTPLIALFRALWDFESTHANRIPSSLIPQEVMTFSSTVIDKQRELQLEEKSIPGEMLKDFLRGLGTHEVPVTAFLGGLLAQDVINVLGKKQQPIQNFLFFDAQTFEAPVYALHPAKGLVQEVAEATNVLVTTALPFEPQTIID